MDINTLPNVNTKNTWWAQSYNESVNLGDKYYIAFGDMSLVYHGAFYVIMFNQNIIDQKQLENPYDLVDSGSWTWAKMYEMMQVAAESTTGTGFDVKADTFGLTGHRVHFKHYMVTADAYLTQETDGLPQFSGIDETYSNAFSDMIDYFMTPDFVAISSVSKSLTGVASTSGFGYYRDMFIEGRSLFLSESTGAMYMFRNTDTPYGVVMFPSYKANPEKLNTCVYSATTGMIVPATTPDEELCGSVLECMNAYSSDTTRKEFIDVTLYYKYAKDERSINMIETILNNGVVDSTFAFDFGGISSVFDDCLTQKTKNITATFQRRETVINNAIKQYAVLIQG